MGGREHGEVETDGHDRKMGGGGGENMERWRQTDMTGNWGWGGEKHGQVETDRYDRKMGGEKHGEVETDGHDRKLGGGGGETWRGGDRQT